MMRRIACSRSQAFSSEAPTMKPWKNSRSAAMIAVASSALVDLPPPRKTMSHRNGIGEWTSVIISPWKGGVLLLWRWPSKITRCASGRLSAKSRSAWSRGSAAVDKVVPDPGEDVRVVAPDRRQSGLHDADAALFLVPVLDREHEVDRVHQLVQQRPGRLARAVRQLYLDDPFQV